MMNIIQKMFKRKDKKNCLKKSEEEWELYNVECEWDIEFVFAFIDQLRIGGHYSCPIAWDNHKTVCNSIIVINLNKRISEEVIIKAIEHEVLHATIAHCLREPGRTGFIETVIDKWIQGTELQCDNWASTINIRKAK